MRSESSRLSNFIKRFYFLIFCTVLYCCVLVFSIVFSLSPNSSTFHILQQLHEHDVPPHGVCAPVTSVTHACNCKHCLVEGALRFGIRCGFPFVFLLPSLVWNLNDLDLRTVVLSSSAFLCCSCCHKYLLLSWSKTQSKITKSFGRNCSFGGLCRYMTFFFSFDLLHSLWGL